MKPAPYKGQSLSLGENKWGIVWPDCTKPHLQHYCIYRVYVGEQDWIN